MPNVTGSVKDRVAKAMIEGGIKAGYINADTVIIEATSGNTGIGLAAVCKAKGLRCIIVMPENMSVERRNLMSLYGAEIVLTPKNSGTSGAVEEAARLQKIYKNSYIPSQFDNPLNPLAHFKTTAKEIMRDLDGNVDCFVAGVGTGGTVSGIGRYFKQNIANIRIVAVEPSASPMLTKGFSAPHKIQGIGANFVPKNFDRLVVDEIITVSDGDAVSSVKTLGNVQGLAVGLSSGAALCAAVSVAKRPEFKGRKIVVLFPDGIDRYFSSGVFDN